jgi:hypothetical protein
MFIGHPRIEQVEYIVTPIGGVIPPIVIKIIKRIPKCTGSKPSLVTIGRKIGVRINTLAVASMNIPITKTNDMTIRSTKY